MFNKNLFNRNAFNRSVSFSTVSASMAGIGTLKTQLVTRVSLTTKQMLGSSTMVCGLVMKQQLGVQIVGTSEFTDKSLYLRMSLGLTKLSGTSGFAPIINIKTPFKGSLNGTSFMNLDNRTYLLQHMKLPITAGGIFNTPFIMQTAIEPITLSGSAALQNSVSLQLPLVISFKGSSESVLRRLSALNENMLELIDINLMPGETVTIDTNLLQVLFGGKEDVSSVTSDSIFFELNPGENEILISTDSNMPLDVTAIWQNRWL